MQQLDHNGHHHASYSHTSLPVSNVLEKIVWIEILSNLLGWVLGLGADAVFIQFLDHNGHSISHLLSHINPTFVEMLHVKNKLLKWKEGKRRLRKSGSTFSSPGFLKRPRSFFCNPHGFNSTFPTVNFRFVLSL